MVVAVEQASADFRACHADVAAAVVLAAGSIGAPAGTLRLGHLAARCPVNASDRNASSA